MTDNLKLFDINKLTCINREILRDNYQTVMQFEQNDENITEHNQNSPSDYCITTHYQSAKGEGFAMKMALSCQVEEKSRQTKGDVRCNFKY